MIRSLLRAFAALLGFSAPAVADELPNTRPLTLEGDLAAQMVEGIDRYLMRELESASKAGGERWKVDSSSREAYLESVKPNRDRLARILGVVDPRISPIVMQFIGEGRPNALVAQTPAYKIFAVRWPVLDGLDGEGLLIEPTVGARASVVALPDADQTPEQLVGLAPGIAAESQFARRLAESGCRVVIPVLIDRQPTTWESPILKRETNVPHREFVWRMAYEMGRHPIGYEVQKTLAAVDWLASQPDSGEVGLYGYCEGGLVALYAAALDPRVKSTVVSGVGYGSRSQVWTEPIDRSIWASLPEFRDEHLRKLFGAKQMLIYEEALPASFEIANPPGYRQQAAGGKLALTAESARRIAASKDPDSILIEGEGEQRSDIGTEWRILTPFQGRFGNRYVLRFFLQKLGVAELADAGAAPTADAGRDPAARQARQFRQLVAYNQRLWRQSDEARRRFWAKAEASSVESWERTTESYRDYFWQEVIGKLPEPTLAPNPRTRLILDTPNWHGYEVVLDLYPDVFAFGHLLLPKDLKPGERRPVVVCQHGLEGRPSVVTDPTQTTQYYNSFGAKLADQGYIVYAPQNPYIGWEKFRILQRKAHPLQLSLFAFIVRQHEATLNWLSTLPNVDGDKIGFYGLSYGGKTAMRVPAILKKYALSICSADFNEWVGKNVSVDFTGSYLWTIEYDMYEFDLGHTFNYAEMANLIAPRPFMVERGHNDGVGIDEMVAYEYAKIRHLYANRLKIADRTAIEFFPGGHEIRLVGTAEFLKKHLGWPK